MVNCGVKLRKYLFLSSALLTGLAAQPALAQQAQEPAAAPQRDPGDIVVTANRREELSQKVGVSITAIGGPVLAQRNVLRSEDLGKLVPGLNATSASGSGVSLFVIRGVGQSDFSDHQEQPNATYQDGVYVPFSTAAGFPVFDLQRIEALRGPQGTLFGRNATGGLIQYVSNKPTSGTSASIEGAVGERNLFRLQGFLNAGTEKISARLAYYFQTQDGFLINTLGRDRGDSKTYALRGQVKFTPTEDTSILLRADGFNQYGTSSGYRSTPSYLVNGIGVNVPENVDAYGTGPGKDLYGYRNPYKGLKVELDDPGLLNKQARTYSGTIEHNLGNATLTSVTSYGTVHSIYREDTDSTPIREFAAGVENRAHDFQQELRISGSTDRFRYTVGAFFLDINGDYTLYNDLPTLFDIAAGTGAKADNAYSLHTRSEAIYGQAEYDLNDRFTAIIGGRYTWDQFKFDYVNHCVQTAAGACNALFAIDTGNAVGIRTVGLGPYHFTDHEGDWSGKAQLNFKPTDDILIYASASKGVKSAGFTAPLAGIFPVSFFKYRPENLYAYEFGEKAQFFNRKLTLNAGAYYYNYKNFQTFLFEQIATYVLNRDATAYGGEIEMSARPGGGITANLGIAYNHFTVHDIATVNAPNGEGQRPSNAPRLQLNWALDKTFDLGGDYSLRLGYSGRYISPVYYNILNVPIVKAPRYSISDFSARLDTPGGWWVSAYLNNAFDKEYQVGAFDVTVLGFSLRQYGEPRTFSVAAGIKF